MKLDDKQIALVQEKIVQIQGDHQRKVREMERELQAEVKRLRAMLWQPSAL